MNTHLMFTLGQPEDMDLCDEIDRLEEVVEDVGGGGTVLEGGCGDQGVGIHGDVGGHFSFGGIVTGDQAAVGRRVGKTQVSGAERSGKGTTKRRVRVGAHTREG
uniref:Uncharacterized protein n=1 Tax=Chromera velia CCMP2878 TaxID=1169474 RepID=A0A0G4GNK0_9ALVE|eukprot:Cvel_22693.t1-p1 / transcript=Cvel_22693.t1 / gene=Cvel_22693 / organism=Chromera_velia_CCMP2878 / gene_product=hypothetical protein / transcript_product=hypothetical protein / location=Cvel_scaffold2259:19682-21067(-) / protein_length=103 / sequence_SO=supercontig / SO=protein_coding / is_pseudo=false